MIMSDVEKRKILFARAKEIVRKNLQKKDRLIIHAIHTLDDLDKEINHMCERLKDWYGIKFPELESIVAEPEKYAEIILALEKKDNLSHITSNEKIKQILDAKSDSMGAEISENDMVPIILLAENIVQISKLRSSVEHYLNVICEEVCPNITYLCGPLLTARFLGMAGGIEQLAEMPASTIQVMGAEKALFKHIRRGSPSPKHGILFQHALISNADKSKRGKIARALAAKIAIASKADAFTHNFIADKLKKDFEERMGEIKK